MAKELSAFGVVGFTCFLIDIGLFQLLYTVVGAGAVTTKLVSTSISMTVAYVGHRFWSFAHRAATDHRRGYLLFVAINVVTLLLGLAIVAVVHYPLQQDGALVLQLANLGSIVVGTAVRWLAYRRWVFPAPAGPDEVAGLPAGPRPELEPAETPARRS